MSRSGTLLIACLALALPIPSTGDVATDGTVGPQVVVAGPDHQIPAELGSRRGKNLFHSFSEFGLDSAEGESATFLAPSEGRVRNVLARVTGPDVSEIDGTIGLEIPGADLYFINPNGVIFGPDAQLDVPGSFHASTADHIRLKGGQIFSASDPASGRLVAAAPAAFGFLPGHATAPIEIRAPSVINPGLYVPEGESISLIGGPGAGATDDAPAVWLNGGVAAAPRGQVNVASVAPGGDALLRSSAAGTSIAVSDSSLAGQIVLENDAAIDVSGFGSGTVMIRGGEFLADRSSVRAINLTADDGAKTAIDAKVADRFSLIGPSAVDASTNGNGDAGDIQISARRLTLEGSAGRADALIQSNATGAGRGGDIRISADVMGLTAATTENGGDANVKSVTNGEGRAGDIRISATSVFLVGGADEGSGNAVIETSTTGPGDAGDVSIAADSLVMRGGTLDDSGRANVSTLAQGSGNAGSIQILTDTLTASGDTSGLFADTEGSGAGGAIRVRAEEVELSADAEISADVRESSIGRGGASGPGGSIDVRAVRVILTSGGQILATARQSSTGNAGSVTVRVADTLSITSSFEEEDGSYDSTGIFASTRAQGNAGRVVVRAPEITMDEAGRISADTLGNQRDPNVLEGDAGSVLVRAKRLTLTGGAAIESRSGAVRQGAPLSTGDSGTVKVVANTISIAGVAPRDPNLRSEIATSTEGSGVGGDVHLIAKRLTLRDGGSITGRSSGDLDGAGDAGSIRVRASELLEVQDRDGILTTAEAASASGGDIAIEAGSLEIVADGGVSTSAKSDAGDVSIAAGTAAVPTNGRGILTESVDETGGDVDFVVLFGEEPFVSPGAVEGKPGSGTISVSSPQLNIAGTLAQLPTALLDLKPLVGCISADTEAGSSLTERVRGAFPSGPDAYLPSHQGDDTDRPPEDGSSSRGSPLPEPRVVAERCAR